ncbi:hypothetical protein RMSM_00890 [Rhodopirellula maiorica SM1]|uniref:Uncharacterized protein n=2 Tax=Novipirellula TaxID=2795426 RepID=M5RS51_9BACT|nr:hypothetical protein RMSM_00890 [Rhodopirellula maiorica SM1]
MSSLGEDVGWSRDFDDQDYGAHSYFGRDPEEIREGENTEAKSFVDVSALKAYAADSGCEYVYVFENNGWKYACRRAQYFGSDDGSDFSEFQWMKSAAIAA